MPTLYLDLDGVLADFNSAARQTLGATSADQAAAAERGRWLEDDWVKLRDQPNFYRHLPKTAFADELVELARRFRDELGWNLYTLTAIPKGNDMPDAFQDKVEWMQEHFPDIRVRFGPYSRDKQRHAQPGDILVDDRKDNCADWDNAGGQAIRVEDRDPRVALRVLAEILENKLSLKRLRQLGDKDS